MIGAIIGDIVGSRFERHNYKGKDFQLFANGCRPTDDSVMTLAVGKALVDSAPDFDDLSINAVKAMQEVGRKYPQCGYGRSFFAWVHSPLPQPYNSYGNGAAMRVSGAGFAGRSLEEVKRFSAKVTEVTHNHPEAMKGAEATAIAVFLARSGSGLAEIREYVEENYYPMDFTIDGIRDSYRFDVSCQGSVPQALMAFFESVSFEDAIRNAVSIGGDSDTIAAITGGIAGAYYGVPQDIREKAMSFMDDYQISLLAEFEEKFSC